MLSRRRVALVSFYLNRSRCHPQSQRVDVDAVTPELLHLLVFHQQRSTRAHAATKEMRRAARRAVQGSRM